ncbi:MAG: DNA-formamidopyrimidine glycosylase family protein [Woeseiaceae bacterium]
MPELPDIDVYITRLGERIGGQVLRRAELATPFLLRSVDPPLTFAEGRKVTSLRRLGKRIAIGLEGDYWLVLHLMIAGRLHWHDAFPGPGGRNRLAVFEFDGGALSLTEAGSKKRASLYFVHGARNMMAHDPGGLEPLQCSFDDFLEKLRSRNRTLKRALTDPGSISGIGNAYSDEILHEAGMSPLSLTGKISDEDARRLYDATCKVLNAWRETLLAESAQAFPEKVTAFRKDMAVHGKFGKPCPVCNTTVQRIRYKSNETNYCPGCQTGGKLLADRSLSRLLKADWPKNIDEL